MYIFKSTIYSLQFPFSTVTKQHNVCLNRKVLSQLAIHEPHSFKVQYINILSCTSIFFFPFFLAAFSSFFKKHSDIGSNDLSFPFCPKKQNIQALTQLSRETPAKRGLGDVLDLPLKGTNPHIVHRNVATAPKQCISF